MGHDGDVGVAAVVGLVDGRLGLGQEVDGRVRVVMATWAELAGAVLPAVLVRVAAPQEDIVLYGDFLDPGQCNEPGEAGSVDADVQHRVVAPVLELLLAEVGVLAVRRTGSPANY